MWFSRVVRIGTAIAMVVAVPSFPSHYASAAGDPIIAAAGDIACDPADPGFNGGNGTTKRCHEKYTANQLTAGSFTAVLALGDTQYNCGGTAAFNQSYDPTWGAVKSKTHPVVGNQEYNTSGGTDCGSGATGYFSYFGSAAGPSGKGYYSFNVGAWHLIALNANCSHVACKAGSAQEQWLKNDLATYPSTCILAFWHQPRFSAGPTTVADSLPFWNDLYAAHADVVLNGHKHNHERLPKLNAALETRWPEAKERRRDGHPRVCRRDGRREPQHKQHVVPRNAGERRDTLRDPETELERDELRLGLRGGRRQGARLRVR